MEYRKAQRDCYCRGCDKLLKRGEDEGIFMYSWRNRGQNIMICDECIDKMKQLKEEKIEESFLSAVEDMGV